MSFEERAFIGSRFYFKRDSVVQNGSTVTFPIIDFGVTETMNPNIAIEDQKYYDPSCGVNRLAATGYTKLTESYELTAKHVAPYLLAMYFMSDGLRKVGQVFATDILSSSYAHPGRLLKVNDALGEPFVGVSAIKAVRSPGMTETVGPNITGFNAAGQITLDAAMTVGTAFNFFTKGGDGTANPRNLTTYRAAAVSGATTLQVTPNPFLTETLTGAARPQVVRANVGTLYGPDDWEPYNLPTGLVRLKSSGLIVAEQDVEVVYDKAELTDDYREFYPQTQTSPITGDGFIVFNSDDCTKQRVRVARFQLTPSSTSFSTTDFSSVTFNAEVIVDRNAARPAGYLRHFNGALPDVA